MAVASTDRVARWRDSTIWIIALLWIPSLSLLLMQLLGWGLMETAIYGLLSVPLVTVAWAVAGLCHVPARRTWRHFAGSVIVLAVVFFGLPMRATFLVSKGSLSDLADEIEDGREMKTSQWAGMIRVTELRDWNGMPCLWNYKTHTGSSGFCRLRKGDPADYVSEFYILNLGDGWYYVVED